MEIVNVENHTPKVSVSEMVKVTFNITGMITPFMFPLSNDSLTKPLIEFISQDS